MIMQHIKNVFAVAFFIASLVISSEPLVNSTVAVVEPFRAIFPHSHVFVNEEITVRIEHVTSAVVCIDSATSVDAPLTSSVILSSTRPCATATPLSGTTVFAATSITFFISACPNVRRIRFRFEEKKRVAEIVIVESSIPGALLRAASAHIELCLYDRLPRDPPASLLTVDNGDVRENDDNDVSCCRATTLACWQHRHFDPGVETGDGRTGPKRRTTSQIAFIHRIPHDAATSLGGDSYYLSIENREDTEVLISLSDAVKNGNSAHAVESAGSFWDIAMFVFEILFELLVS